MPTACTIAAGSFIQCAETGRHWQVNKDTEALIISVRYGIYRVMVDGRIFSVDYKSVIVHD